MKECKQQVGGTLSRAGPQAFPELGVSRLLEVVLFSCDPTFHMRMCVRCKVFKQRRNGVLSAPKRCEDVVECRVLLRLVLFRPGTVIFFCYFFSFFSCFQVLSLFFSVEARCVWADCALGWVCSELVVLTAQNPSSESRFATPCCVDVRDGRHSCLITSRITLSTAHFSERLVVCCRTLGLLRP